MAGKKTRYSDNELKDFEALIQKKLDSAQEELTFYQEQMKDTNSADDKFSGLEDGTGTLEKEYLNTMISRQMTFIKHLNDAIIRIKNKSYGVCRSSGELISEDRLRAVPHATLSIKAKLAQRK